MSQGAGAVPAVKLVLNTSHTAPLNTPERSGLLDQFYQELFSRLGVFVDIQYLPAERSLINANQGIDDGDVCRIAGMEKSYPNLVRVPERVMSYEHVIFSRSAGIHVRLPEDLKPYDVGVVKGWKIIEWNTTPAHSVTLVDSGEQLFAMLNQGRIDLAIIERLSGLMLIREMGYSGIQVLEPPFLSGDWYLYLHRRHSHLVPILAEEIRRMKADGSYQRIFEAAKERFSLPH
ncbi:MAG: transporter substrate-binding domain-containing protein [Magnetococcales bacterium]|nr:transporter substrate-binding domain-containing protein [Magnetococcales bacterium]